jgi:hypothetical protein
MKYTVEQLKPTDRLVVQPGPVKTFTQIIETPDKEKNKGKKEEDVHKMKQIKNEVKTDYVVGKVVAIDPSKDTYKIGDWVVYNYRLGVALDLFGKKFMDPKCPIMLRYYDVVGTINNDELNGK